MLYGVYFSVLWRDLNDGCAEGVADGLVTEANAKEWGVIGDAFMDHINADARVFGAAGTGGDEDAFGVHVHDSIDSGLIVSDDCGFYAQIAEILVEVVGEAVVIVDEY